MGVVLASLLIVYRITQETTITLEDKSHTNQELDADLLKKHIRVIKIDGAFFFGSSTAFESQANAILDTKTVIVDIVNVPFIDITAIFTLMDLISQLQADKINVIIILKDTDKEQLQKLDKSNLLNSVVFYDNMNDAIQEV